MGDALWLLGGLDPTGGAGLLRDFASARAVRPHLATRSIATALTLQGHGASAIARAVSRDDLRFQLDHGPAPSAIKIGLVPRELVEVVVAFVDRWSAPVVVDPVLVASDGGDLGADAIALRPLLDRAALVTPNRAEAAVLGACTCVLYKDAEDDPHVVVDILVDGDRQHRFARPRVPGPDPRGTGCALATAIAAGLAGGDELHAAVGSAIAWLDDARTRARSVGSEPPQLPG